MLGKLLSSSLLICACVGMVHAETDGGTSAFSLRGFGTVGLARSSSEHAEFVRDFSQPTGIKGGQWSGRIDSILGLQANWRATPEFELVGQAVSRLHYDYSHNPELMWAFAKWEPDPRLSLRAGRIGADFMMLADSRLVGYSYLPVRPSVDFFGPLFFSHFDGADASVTVPLGDGLVRGKLFAGKTHEKSAGALGIWDTSGSPVRGLVLDYVTGPWQFRVNAARIRFADDINTFALAGLLRSNGADAAADALQAKDTVTRFLSLGVVYDKGPLQVQGMLNRIRHETGIFENSHAGYLLAGYRFGTLTPYAGVSWWKSSSKTNLPVVPVPLDQVFKQFIAGTHVDRTTYTLGSRWDLRDNMALKFQWDAVRATPDTWFSVRNRDADWNGKTDVLSVTLDFVF
ncbi:MAG: hypothetical protein Q8L56_08710 [Rhodocyclaceae bacterium]|nr:hypothetical protein [Rhodocyclaceae bacterium]